VLAVATVGLVGAVMGCGSKAAPATATCDQACIDGIALRSVRETLKLVFNLTLQGNAVGMQDETTPCPQGGTARVFGVVTSNSVQGATMVELTYVLDQCAYLSKNSTATRNYDVTITGTVTEVGTLAVQPTATTALLFGSMDLSVIGTVNDPPSDYHRAACALKVTQNGNDVTGTWCGVPASFSF
jgi:hypothetical protein